MKTFGLTTCIEIEYRENPENVLKIYIKAHRIWLFSSMSTLKDDLVTKFVHIDLAMADYDCTVLLDF